MFRLVSAAALALILTSPALAADFTAGSLKISQPWARATPKGAQVGGGYMTITNTGAAPDRLVGGASGVAASFEVHEMSMDGGIMKMRMLKDGLEIKPGETVALKPGGYHVMFVGLKDQLKQGDIFKGTLQFEKAGKVEIEYKIEGIAATGGGSPSGHGGMNMKH
ncbi:copper chaperone PCu(A)C [Undibacter mobilis]|uniref:Copper chaperone PCu(A)C n=1 Tax=Undibacter mobilis TaxID=2292256 RepID=A0A371B392_9BRAD|nr:copper chaperone PCu(A)C [Undibacter mobilis]RDV01931.1 copper chaperone PCu(A)C [Undibacter mobilis]